MSKVSVSTKINTSADEVWKTICDFSAVGKYITTIANVTMEGSGVGALRVLTRKDGTQIVERLENVDPQARTLRYAIVSSPLPLKNYVSTMKVRDLGANRCKLEWSSTFEATGAPEADVEKLIENVYSRGFNGLKKLHGS
ncbi:MAG: SRPBCC family protein [Thermodesulfobacteriota bacterium]